MVHNLRLFSFQDPKPQAWALHCDEDLRARIEARLAVPTPEHYYPLLYALALQDAGETAGFLNARVVSAISMTSVLIGDPAVA